MSLSIRYGEWNWQMKNKLHWNTITTDDDRVLYLAIMRDLKTYSRRGYCDLEICFYRFVELPDSFIHRRLAAMKVDPYCFVDWKDYDGVLSFIKKVIKTLCSMINETLWQRQFTEAFDEFAQYLRKKKLRTENCP